ncbi:phospholipase D family protein [Corallococcus terminator]
MSEIPRAVLSEHFQERMKERRLVSAIFTTFRFEPGFFESEVLPVFFDIPLSHAPAIKLVQLEEALRALPGSITVYYDQHGLVPEGGAAKLDTRRIPIRHATGIFHPKNVLVLVEDAKPAEDGKRDRALLCACASANLTRAGWWENVEVAHVEEIGEGAHTSLRDALLRYLDALVGAAEGRRANDELRAHHGAARDIRAFLRGTTQRENRSVDGKLLSQFHDGEASLPDFLEEASGKALHGLCLEVISPYFDGGGTSAPLTELLERFQIQEARVFLPRNDKGEALCSEELFAWMQAQPGVAWGALPGELLRLGRAEDSKHRTVHAKVYRFFQNKRGGREILFVGSANLTTAGCRVAGRGGNWETGFLVEATSGARPDWWMGAETRRPLAFLPREETEGSATDGGTRLMLRFRWDTHTGSAFWDDSTTAPPLLARHGGITVLEISDLSPRTWVPLNAEQCQRLETTLHATSLLEIVGPDSKPGFLLVQEEGMFARPSVLLDLSAADILRYWALLTVEQRAAFIEARANILGDDDPLLAKLAPLPFETTLFDRFAGIFHAFESLDQHVRQALADARTREADYRLFGKKYDSLGSLLERVLKDAHSGNGERVEHYVVTLCAKQLLREIGRAYPDYWADHREDVRRIETHLGDAASLRDALATGHSEMPAFLDWFERWFLQRAEALPEKEQP